MSVTIGDIVRRKGTYATYLVVDLHWKHGVEWVRIQTIPQTVTRGGWDRLDKYVVAQTAEERVAEELMR